MCNTQKSVFFTTLFKRSTLKRQEESQKLEKLTVDFSLSKLLLLTSLLMWSCWARNT